MNPFRMIQRRFDTWNAFLRRRPIAKIRVNWIVIALLGFCVMGSLYNAYDIFGQDQEPRPTPLSVLFSSSPGENRHVEVTGLLFPETHLSYPAASDANPRPVQYTYVAMIEDHAKRVLLVRFPGDLGQGEPRHASIPGLLVGPDATLRRYLKSQGGKIGGLPIEDRYYLLAGATPVPIWFYPAIGSLFLCFFVPLTLAEVRYVLAK